MSERELFLTALEIEDSAEREAFLREQCGDDTELLTRVESLLASHEGQSQFLRTPAVEQMGDDPEGLTAATLQMSNDSTEDEELDSDAFDSNPGDTMIRNPGEVDEIPLGYLEPSSRKDSLGRLDHYEILEVIGRGAFGIVLRAFDEELHRVVAIKVLAPQMAAMSPARKRFKREAKSSAAVRHENVVSIYAVEDDPIPYLVMEYIPGETLQQRLNATGPLEISEVLRLGKQIADGLAAAHAQGLIHRDIKPGNILLDTSIRDQVKITDFGLARTADDASMTQSGVIAGTPMYMAPEQALGHKLDQRADLFSLGSVLYQMISGRPPFRARTTVAVLKRLTEDKPRPIQDIIPETPDWICHLIAHLHAKDPEDRFDSAQEVSELLGNCLEDVQAGRAPNVPPPQFETQELAGTPAEPHKPTRRWGRKLTQVAAVVILLLAGLGLTEATGVTKLTNTVVRLMTGSGTLVIESDDPGVKIAIDGEEVTIRGGGVKELTLRPGKYTVAALKDGQPVKRELVTITRNGQTKLRMSLEADGDSITKRTDVGTAPLADVLGRYSLEFDGEDDYVATPLKPDGSTPITIEATVRISEWLPADDPGQEIVATTDNGGFGLGIAQDANTGGFKMVARSGPNYVGISTRRSEEYLNRSVKLAGVVDEDEVRLFLDGNLVARRLLPHPLSASDEKLSLGTSPGYGKPNDGHGFDFKGQLSEVRISKIARYSENYTAVDRLEADEHTLALYHFDEGQGDILKDSSGNGHHGKIVGAKWVHRPVDSREPASEDSIDLIARLDPERDFLDERLKLEDGKVIAPEWGNSPGAIAMIPYGPVPDEYDIELRLERLTNWRAGFNFGIVVGGRQVTVGMDCGDIKKHVWGLDFLDGQSGQALGNPTRNPGQRFRVGKTSDVTIQVRKNRVVAICDGESLIDWTGRPEQLGLWKAIELPRNDSLFFLAQAGFVVHKMTLIPRGAATSQDRSFQSPADAPPPAIAPFTDADVARIAALPAEQQIEEVRRELIRRNPGFDGELTPTIKNDKVIRLSFHTDHITDISPVRSLSHLLSLTAKGSTFRKGSLVDLSPLRGMKLTMLNVDYNKVRDLTPLRGMPLTGLYVSESPIRDLDPLQGMPLESLFLWYWTGSDLTSLAGMSLKRLNVGSNNRIRDLAPLAGMPLEFLCINNTRVSDLSPIKDAPLTTLECERTLISDVSPLRRMNLTRLNIASSKVADLSSLEGMPLKLLSCDSQQATQNAEVLRGIESLEKINETPVAEFWKKADQADAPLSAPPANELDD